MHAANTLSSLTTDIPASVVISDGVLGGLITASAIVFVVVVARVSWRLRVESWSLADALSEEAGTDQTTALPAPPSTALPALPSTALPALPSTALSSPTPPTPPSPTPPNPPSPTPPTPPAPMPPRIPGLLPSTSRLIALYGLIGNLTLFMAYGFLTLWFAGKGVATPELTRQVADLMMYGLVMFAPYTVNKFAAVFEGLLPKK